MNGATKIGAGHYFIAGVHCWCGGRLDAGRAGKGGESEWELFCVKCLACDPNGYATLRECVEAANDRHGYFAPPITAGEYGQ